MQIRTPLGRGHHADRRTGPSPAWLWAFQATTGALLLVLLTVHIIAQHYVAEGGLRTYAEVVSWLRNPLVFTTELVFLVTVTWHALAGIRGIVADFGPKDRTERIVSRGLALVGIATVAYGAWLIVTVANG
jgi:succinate dehydrogenase / fumarate reductase membrane anchor subunit